MRYDLHDEGVIGTKPKEDLGPLFAQSEPGIDAWKSERPDRTEREKLVRAAALLLAEIERLDREENARGAEK